MNHAARIIDRFGGVRPLAKELGYPSSTVHSWKVAGRIPAKHQPIVLALAQRLKVGLTHADFFDAAPAQGEAA